MTPLLRLRSLCLRHLTLSCLAALLATAPAAFADLSLRLESTAVTVTGATPDRQVIFYGFAHEEEDFVGVIAKHEGVVVADAAGAASYALPRAAAARSLWFAVDVQTGAIASAVPEGFPLRRIDVPPAVVNRRDGFDALEVPFSYGDVLLVRPETGAWTLAARRGGPKDLKIRRETLAIDPRSFRNLKGNTPGPANVRRDDVVIVVDPYALAFFSFRWDK